MVSDYLLCNAEYCYSFIVTVIYEHRSTNQKRKQHWLASDNETSEIFSRAQRYGIEKEVKYTDERDRGFYFL